MEFQSKQARTFFVMLTLLLCAISLVVPTDNYPNQIRRVFYISKWVDDVTHILMFSTLMIFIPLVLGIRVRRVVVGLVLFAVCTEMLQGFTGRTPSMSDVLMDVFGVTIGVAIILLWRRKAGAKTL
jgi:VanZ family protein